MRQRGVRGRLGGIEGLGELLATRWGSLEADFDRYYHRDLTVEYERMSVRRMLALVNGLPLDSATLRDGKAWTQERELLAEVVEHVDYWGRAVATAAFVGASRSDRKRFLGSLKKPTRLQHPHRQINADAEQPAAPKQISSREEIAQFFNRLRR